MNDLKRINADGVETALDKAAHYRLLNEPLHAESICLDVLEVESTNQRALTTLLLALTDQFPTKLYSAFQQAEQIIPQLSSDYDREYYNGIVNERWAITQHEQSAETKSVAVWIGRAMKCYENAEALSDGNNPDPILRWNTCARLRHQIGADDLTHTPLVRDIRSEYGDDVPPR